MSTKTQGPTMRRVVVGEAPDGMAIVSQDVDVAPVETKLFPGARFFSLWGADTIPTLPNDGTEPPFRTWFPPDGGFRFELIVLPPADAKAPDIVDLKTTLAETETLLPGLVGTMDPRHPGMHRTDTIDLIYVTEGACVLTLEDGEETTLKAGDSVVLNGPRHAWRNPQRALRTSDRIAWRQTRRVTRGRSVPAAEGPVDHVGEPATAE